MGDREDWLAVRVNELETRLGLEAEATAEIIAHFVEHLRDDYLSEGPPCRDEASPTYTRRMTKKRGYSRDFRPHGDTGKRHLLDEIPAGLWAKVRDKAKREGVSLRALILKLLEQWVKAPPEGSTVGPYRSRR